MSGGSGLLAQDGGLLAVKFLFSEGAFVAELLELAQLINNAVLGVGGGVIGRIGAGIAGGVGSGPNEADDPGDKSPAQEQVDGEDATGAGVVAKGGDDGWEEIEDQADAAGGETEYSMEKVERIVIHGRINLANFCFERWWIFCYFVIQSTFKCKKADIWTDRVLLIRGRSCGRSGGAVTRYYWCLRGRRRSLR